MTDAPWGDGPVPYGFHAIDDDDIAAVVAVLRSTRLTTGPTVPAFEAALSEATGAGHAIACANGTAALHLTALALGLGPGDAVVVPTLTFVATANGPHMTGAEVRFADVDPATGLMTAESLTDALDRDGPGVPKAVYVTQLNGAMADMDAIAAIARKRGLPVVEDACHALGTRWGGPDGTAHRAGDGAAACMATFSFHPVKAIAMGEGGAVTTNDPALARSLTLLREHGIERDPRRFTRDDEAFDANGAPLPWYYEQQRPGLNYRVSEIHAALGLSQLGKLDRFRAARQALKGLYDTLLAPLAPAIRPVLPSGGSLCPHLYPVRIDFDALATDRPALMAALLSRGIGSQVHYMPVHRQAYWRARYGPLTLTGADRYYKEVLTLPLHSGLGEKRLRAVVSALRDLAGDAASAGA